MKNLKFNKKGFAALLLAGNMLLFGGCCQSEKKDECEVINPDSLSDTLVVTRSDGTVDVAEKISIPKSIFDLNYDHNQHAHYESLITGEFYSTNECDIDEVWAGPMIHYSELNSQHVSSYLTEDDLFKIKNGEFTRTDEDNVLKKIMESNAELTNGTEKAHSKNLKK